MSRKSGIADCKHTQTNKHAHVHACGSPCCMTGIKNTAHQKAKPPASGWPAASTASLSKHRPWQWQAGKIIINQNVTWCEVWRGGGGNGEVVRGRSSFTCSAQPHLPSRRRWAWIGGDALALRRGMHIHRENTSVPGLICEHSTALALKQVQGR